MTYECGDVVIFSTGGGRKTNVGMILKKKEDNKYVVLTRYNTVYKNIEEEWILLSEEVDTAREEIEKYYSVLISEKEKCIRRVTQEEKDVCKKDKYEKLQQEIKICAKRLSESTDDEFERRLKAITDMKKRLFSIELDCVSEIRKENGRHKAEIRSLKSAMDCELSNISDKSIDEAFNF